MRRRRSLAETTEGHVVPGRLPPLREIVCGRERIEQYGEAAVEDAIENQHGDPHAHEASMSRACGNDTNGRDCDSGGTATNVVASATAVGAPASLGSRVERGVPWSRLDCSHVSLPNPGEKRRSRPSCRARSRSRKQKLPPSSGSRSVF